MVETDLLVLHADFLTLHQEQYELFCQLLTLLEPHSGVLPHLTINQILEGLGVYRDPDLNYFVRCAVKYLEENDYMTSEWVGNRHDRSYLFWLTTDLRLPE